MCFFSFWWKVAISTFISPQYIYIAYFIMWCYIYSYLIRKCMHACCLIRPHPWHVAWWIIAANNIVPSIIAQDSGTPNPDGAGPHHLSVVVAYSSSGACVGVVIVILCFCSPHTYCNRTSKSGTTTLGYVFAIGPVGGGSGASDLHLISVVLSVCSQCCVPCNWPHTHLSPRGGVGVHVVLGRVLATY